MTSTFVANPPKRIICETPQASDAVAFLRDKGYKVSMLDEIRGGIPNLLFER
jgi:hypothetical protein